MDLKQKLANPLNFKDSEVAAGSSAVLAHLESQKAAVEQKIADYQRLKTEIEAAVDLVRQCKGCRVKPSRANCEACSVVTSRKKIPLPFQAIS